MAQQGAPSGPGPGPGLKPARRGELKGEGERLLLRAILYLAALLGGIAAVLEASETGAIAFLICVAGLAASWRPWS